MSGVDEEIKAYNIRLVLCFLSVLLVPRKFSLLLGFSGKFYLNMILCLLEKNNFIKVFFHKEFRSSGSEKRQY